MSSNARQLAANLPREGGLSNRNLIINGAHTVNQRGVTSVTTGVGTSTFTTDRWFSYGSGQVVNITIQEVTLPDGTVTNSHKTTGTTTRTDWLHPAQKIEAFGKAYLRGKPVTISTWVRTNISGQRIRICDTVNCYELGDEIPSDGAWHYITATHTMPSNMAIGASNDIQVQPAFGTTNLVSGSYIEFTLMQVEVGDTATPFEHRSYGDELARCQRYFQVGWISGYTWAPNQSVHNAGSYERREGLPVQMRATPSNSYSFTDHDQCNDNGMTVSNRHASAFTQTRYSGQYCNGTWSYKLDAEL